MIFENESDEHSRELFEYACRKENAHPDFVHSDNGNPMKGKLVFVDFFSRFPYFISIIFPIISDKLIFSVYSSLLSPLHSIVSFSILIIL